MHYLNYINSTLAVEGAIEKINTIDANQLNTDQFLVIKHTLTVYNKVQNTTSGDRQF